MKILKHIIILFVFTSSALANGFTDSHDSTKSYAHPSFVLYNDEPYRTLKAVPVNTLITNTEYWVSLKTEASQQTLPQGETPPETDTSQLTNSVPTNDTPLVAPSFSVGSTDAVNYQENGSSSVYTADATGALSYSISSGDDIGLFEINSATGVLTFKSSPDYESPTDQGSNNNYSVTITATNSAGTAELSLSVVVTDGTSDNLTPPQNAKIINVNVRGTIGPKSTNELRIMAFQLTANADVLLRGIGPQLDGMGGLTLDVLLPDPIIQLKKYATVPGTPSSDIVSGDNDNYDTNNTNVAEMDTVRNSLSPVFPFNPKQAASMPSLEAGFYSMFLHDDHDGVEKTAIGVAAVDLANADSTSAAFTHVSSRGLVNQSEYLFGGFQITGEGKRKLFIRGRGPSLAGIAGLTEDDVMSDTLLELHQYESVPGTPSTPVDDNDDYATEEQTTSEIKAEILSLSTSLYGWSAINDNESALLIEVDPGFYSIILKSKSSSTDGVGWIGIDDVTDL